MIPQTINTLNYYIFLEFLHIPLVRVQLTKPTPNTWNKAFMIMTMMTTIKFTSSFVSRDHFSDFDATLDERSSPLFSITKYVQ